MKVALFGGSFNPPHVCHVLAATWVLSVCEVDCVWFVPTYQHAFGKRLASFDARCEMTRRAIAPLGTRARVSRIEAELGRVSRTIDTLTHLHEKFPETTFSLVIGADILLEAHKWKRFDDLQRMATFHVLGRAGFAEDRDYGVVLPDVSSTDIRDALSRRHIEAVKDKLPSGVLEFILEHGLYLDASPPDVDAEA
ncbi:MAG: nicotinate (nicotinamide) nucleotide adenylyltransferase [Myxococcales bacterium]|nr:nicotinate (nicotinamide) nucleotide adenylyltransferase [Myxococcales bacterium]